MIYLCVESHCWQKIWSWKWKIVQSNQSTNNHLSTTATFFVLADSPYIGSYLNLSTMATCTELHPQLLRKPWQWPIFSATGKKVLVANVASLDRFLMLTFPFKTSNCQENSDWQKSQKWSRNVTLMARWWLMAAIVFGLCSIYSDAVSTNCLYNTCSKCCRP